MVKEPGKILLPNSRELRVSRHTNMRTHTRYQRFIDQNSEKKYKAVNPLLCLNAPEDETQSVLMCKTSVPTDSSTNQMKQKTLSDTDNISHSFKPLNNTFSSGCSSDNHSPYPLNNIVISINGIHQTIMQQVFDMLYHLISKDIQVLLSKLSL